jgi:F-type H+-transporting ATPase subunit b
MAESHTSATTLASGGSEPHAPSAFGITAPGFVAIAMLIVIGIMLWQRVPSMIAGMLDARIATIKSQLDEAARLRGEAEALLAQAKARHKASSGDAEAIIANAQEEAKALLAKAERDAADLTARRAKMAEDKIAAAERTAIAEVRATAADAAAQAAAAIIADRHDAKADKPLVDRTITGLARIN